MKITSTNLRNFIHEAIVDPQVRQRYPTPSDIISTVGDYLDPQEISKLRALFETDDIEDVNAGLSILNSVYSMLEDPLPDDYVNEYFAEWNESEVSSVAYAAPSIFLQEPIDMSGLVAMNETGDAEFDAEFNHIPYATAVHNMFVEDLISRIEDSYNLPEAMATGDIHVYYFASFVYYWFNWIDSVQTPWFDKYVTAEAIVKEVEPNTLLRWRDLRPDQQKITKLVFDHLKRLGVTPEHANEILGDEWDWDVAKTTMQVKRDMIAIEGIAEQIYGDDITLIKKYIIDKTMSALTADIKNIVEMIDKNVIDTYDPKFSEVEAAREYVSRKFIAAIDGVTQQMQEVKMKTMKITKRQLIKLITESINDDSSEDVKKLMALYYQAMDMFNNNDEAAEGVFQQAFELASMSGLTRHPDWKVWYIYNGENGTVLVEGLSYDQAVDPRYLALAMSDINWSTSEDEYDVYNQFVSHNPPSEEHLNQAYNEMIKKGFPDGPKIVEIDDEHGAVEIWWTEDPKFEFPDYGV